ncbi:uncharacterized protein Z518_02039 [Rhinocladiella mackenziei CBS 650.93]|uniref:Rhinocladiella mackenziei CBS 650.93 unplaced genomic scaffold supercont1.2, whole genome shotgun sequence n=1 Tax=Rhinocladiella mackenziei CBS 650.93 TaxID=1442369 RepID=A0A0D2IVY1_9EURO|nr:uncharacterized protein Z518_02039 [Rhinocladiella mackenziei CBS 650.93]KIX07386.1 hypothetical protein Z518_02039 [Rhinocladiella mackenziei CBS 650.93]
MDQTRWELIGKRGRWQIRQINPYTDGDQRHWPPRPYRPSSEERYLIQLGKAWAQKDELDEPGVEYYLNKLPDGYALFELDQPSGNQVYKRLFGHPSGKFYDSIVKFQIHFLWLMSGMQGICKCVHCGNPKLRTIISRNRPQVEHVVRKFEKRRNTTGVESETSTRSNSTNGRGLGAPSTRPQRQIKAAGAPYATDEEGVEDVFKDYLKRLEAAKGGKKGIEDDIREVNSMDWRAEHAWDGYGIDQIEHSLTVIKLQHSFIPRLGELVLWCPNFLGQHYLMLDKEKLEFKFYSFDQKSFHGFPEWRGGVIAAVPSATALDKPIDFPDIQNLPGKRNSLNAAGFRVETFPDPNDEIDKKASKQYRYVPMRNIRPLSHWQMLLRGIPRDKWHPSIESALTCMTSLSLLEKWWFNGGWPYASIWCKGIYLGSELVIIGDTVRLAPQPTPSSKRRECTDVMVVDSVRLNLLNIRAEHTMPESPVLSSASSITLVGRAYTLDIRRHYQMQGKDPDADQIDLPSPVPLEEVKTVFRPVGTGEYGSWYHLHGPRQRYEVSYDQVLGRLYEADAVKIWTGLLQFNPAPGEKPNIKPGLTFDVGAIEEGRRYATQADKRLEEAEKGEVLWFWADTRAEALDIETINGCEVGRYNNIRDPHTLEEWKMKLKVLNGQQVTSDLFQCTSSYPSLTGAPRRRPPGSKVVNGKLIKPRNEGYDEAVAGNRPEPQSTPRHKSSQLAGAALISTDEEDEVFEDAGEEFLSEVEGNLRHAGVRKQSPTTPKQRQTRTKAQIMSNDEVYISGDDDEWYNEPLPLARGGTEETEGGDYDPRSEDVKKDSE